MSSPRIIVIAGPNGAGKTTTSRALLADTLGITAFVNADAIAQGLSGFDPQAVAVEAGRIMLTRLRELAVNRASFAFETTLATRSYAHWLAEQRRVGYHVTLCYFWLASSELAIARVMHRVRNGGHSIPNDTVIRRYRRSIYNLFHLYLPLVDAWAVYDNSRKGEAREIALGCFGVEPAVYDLLVWETIRKQAQEYGRD